MEVWPSLDLMDGRVVRLIRGDPKNVIVYSHDPIMTAKRWEEAEADGLHIVDLDAALGIGNNFQTIERVAGQVKLRMQVGGGIHSLEDVDRMFQVGVDRVILGTALLTGKIDASQLLEYGADRVVVALDHVDGRIVVDGWKRKLQLELYPTLRRLWNIGYRIFLCTSAERDGTLMGFNVSQLDSIRHFARNMYVAGGISSLNDLKTLKGYNVLGVILGRVLYDKIIDIKEAIEVARSGSC